MKLKTLKDLIREENNGPKSMSGTEIIEHIVLKRAAIEHLIKIEEDATTLEGAQLNLKILTWIKKFFCITEEDIKDETI